MSGARRIVVQCLLALTLLLPGFAAARAQGIDAPTPTRRDLPPTKRLDILAQSLGMTKLQKDDLKIRIDAAHKAAAPARATLSTAHAAMMAAAGTGKPEDLDAAVGAYAAALTTMTELEVKALAEVLATLTPEQQTAARTNGIRTSFFLFRGIFLDDKRWNVEPPAYGY